ncbi:hypothetical protein [Massilia rubra]|uniref:Uncharacterized protein n=1 Tax=Massilia rubra TaxID=2607910 RepID=A0ABX0LTQ8_9BURK|nr:hypothetical protein [Massilia rubra]NHZ38234.1 hypothetical protein [Massilia rubra]
MKAFGILILVAGLVMAGYALNMNVSVDVPARDYGYGVSTPAMEVANIDRMAQRQNFLIFAGVLSIVGAILTGFAAIAPKSASPAALPVASVVPAETNETVPPSPGAPVSVRSIRSVATWAPATRHDVLAAKPSSPDHTSLFQKGIY